MDLTISSQGGNTSTNVLRDYRKGNWTFQETMVLIEAKKMDDERRMRRLGDGGERGKPAELRWKWVEDYCWKNGCLRSQNQCNDKWDNLMRDFKKVREYERRVAAERGGGGGGGEDHHNSINIKSYWRIEKNERKDKSLPSNMLPQIYEALVEVVERKGGNQRGMQVGSGSGTGTGGSSSAANTMITILPTTTTITTHVVDKEKSPPTTTTTTCTILGHSMPPPLIIQQQQQQQHPIIRSPAMLLPLPLPSAHTPTELHHQFPFSQPLPTVDSDTSEHTDSPAKRRKRTGGPAAGEGTSGGTDKTLQEVGSAISKSASIIAEAIQSCEEREERRHREVLSIQERRLQIEESKAEINRQGINGLVDAINKLANSILALASRNNQPPPPPPSSSS